MKRESYSDEIVNLSEEVELGEILHMNPSQWDMVLLECMIN